MVIPLVNSLGGHLVFEKITILQEKQNFWKIFTHLVLIWTIQSDGIYATTFPLTSLTRENDSYGECVKKNGLIF